MSTHVQILHQIQKLTQWLLTRAIRPLKILALHGGGQTANGLRSMQGIQDLMNSLSEFEFVFASTPESNNVWIRDPPGGKGEPTTDRDWADASIDYLDQIVEEQGPFYAILDIHKEQQ